MEFWLDLGPSSSCRRHALTHSGERRRDCYSTLMLALARPETVQAIVDGGHLEWTAEALKKVLLDKARHSNLEAEDPNETLHQFLTGIGAVLFVWCEKLGVCSDFYQRLGVAEDEMLQVQFRTLQIPMARGLVEKGSNLTNLESQELVSKARAASDVIAKKKKKKKGGKGKKGRR